jgi:hypothetical protein
MTLAAAAAPLPASSFLPTDYKGVGSACSPASA